MNTEPLDIDRIVREIVGRLRAEVEGQHAATLVVDARVVTLEQLDGKLEGVKKVVLGSKAVVTPAARDELAAKNITVVQQTAE